MLAKSHLKRAFELDGSNARLLMELDQLYKKLNVSFDERLQLLEKHLDLVLTRDDLYLERLSLYSLTGAFEKALDLLQKKQFHPWEGGEGKVPFQYVTVHVELAKNAIQENRFSKAVDLLIEAQTYPINLGEGKLFGTQENDIMYWLGNAYCKLGQKEKAIESWEIASEGLSNPSAAMFYNDQNPDKIFYQGLALLKLNRYLEAEKCFKSLVQYGDENQNNDVKLDYFAISLPDLLIWEEDLNDRNKMHCHYLIGLGEMGLGNLDKAERNLNWVLDQDRYHLSAMVHRTMLKSNMLELLK